MQITFLIGNGFDMRMGIASSYKAAEEHYAQLKKTDEDLKKFQKSLSDNGEYWSNFELATGKYTAEFDENAQAKFQKCLDDFTIELANYLAEEEKKIDYSLCEEEIKKEFFRSISSFDNELERKYRNQLDNIIKTGEVIFFRFVSFNYTHILDECLKLSFKDGTVVGSHKKNSTIYNHGVKKDVIHIHGSLPGPIIMGVDNTNQIENKAWAGQKRFKQKIIKPSMNERAGSLVDADTANTINNSSIICVFGMSLGDTDKTWWKHIGEWLLKADRRLIIFAHKSNLSERELTHPKRFTLEDEIKDQFMDLAEISSTNRAIAEDRIYVYINSELFNINLVELTEEKKKTAEIEKEVNLKAITALYEVNQKEAELAKIL